MKMGSLVGSAVSALLAVACGGGVPVTSITGTASPTRVAGVDESGGVATMAATSREAITGTIDAVGAAPPGGVLITPSGMCHFRDYLVFTRFTGDVEGPATFTEQLHAPCDFSHIAGSGPFEATVTWKGRAGTISGQWTTNCKADASEPIGVSCDGTMNARGAGGLEGVQFHFKWGPGWYPFPYTGTALSK